ncbi:MAG: hypothetical protein WBD50_01095 [Candidatus Rhabdochlamydia sp.]
MACSASPVTLPSTTQFREAFLSKDSKRMQLAGAALIANLPDPEKIALSCVEKPNHKGLKSRVVVVLSNTIRNVAIIETTRFLAIIGLVCSAFASVLLPALGFAAIAAGACVLKNRAIQLDAKDRPASAAAAEEVFNQTLEGSTSTVPRTSQENLRRTISREGSTRSNVTASLGPISEDTSEVVPTDTDIKEISLDAWAAEQKLNINQLYCLLNFSYSSLSDKKQDMPLSLERKGVKNETKKYLDQKIERYSKETQKNFPNLDNEGDSILGIENLEALRGALKNAKPSSIMKFVKNIHQKISQEQNSYGNEKEAGHHNKKAEHAEEYITKLEQHESKSKNYFTEDINN